MEENVNFDNEVLAYLTIRKVSDRILSLSCGLNIGSTDRKPQVIYQWTP